jgi:VTC domain-containing protein
MKPRNELRFAISPEMALQLRDFVRSYLEMDEYSVGKPDYSYSVHTVYLDSDDWKIYWRTVLGDQDRWKLRLRYYNDNPDSPVFCEVKHQMNDVTVKYRGGVRREALGDLLAGHLPHPEQLLSQGRDQSVALERFVAMLLETDARPRLHISWLREAYIGDYSHSDARVTMDREIRANAVSDDSLAVQMDPRLVCSNRTIILGLRFTERFPDWYREMTRVFGLGEPLFWEHNQGAISCAGLTLREAELVNNIIL